MTYSNCPKTLTSGAENEERSLIALTHNSYLREKELCGAESFKTLIPAILVIYNFITFKRNVFLSVSKSKQDKISKDFFSFRI